MNLTEIRSKILGNRIILVIVFLLIIILAVFLISIRPENKYTVEELPKPVAQQEVKDGKFDKEAPTSVTSKLNVDKIKSRLPKREEFTTRAGTKVSYTLFFKPTDEHSLYIETTGINPLIPTTSDQFPLEILEMREASARAFSWLEDNGVEVNSVFIIWSDGALQKAAETALLESPEYPNIIKDGDKWVFERPSPQPSPQE